MDELNIKVDMIDRYFPLILIGCQRDPAYQNYQYSKLSFDVMTIK